MSRRTKAHEKSHLSLSAFSFWIWHFQLFWKDFCQKVSLESCRAELEEQTGLVLEVKMPLVWIYYPVKVLMETICPGKPSPWETGRGQRGGGVERRWGEAQTNNCPHSLIFLSFFVVGYFQNPQLCKNVNVSVWEKEGKDCTIAGTNGNVLAQDQLLLRQGLRHFEYWT